MASYKELVLAVQERAAAPQRQGTWLKFHHRDYPSDFRPQSSGKQAEDTAFKNLGRRRNEFAAWHKDTIERLFP